VGLSLPAGINCVCCFALLMSSLPAVRLALLTVTVFVLAVEFACAALVDRSYYLNVLKKAHVLKLG
jgi:hypothetical protein